jgi:hypothetical protein
VIGMERWNRPRWLPSGSRKLRDARCSRDASGRGEQRRGPRYHPSCTACVAMHLSANACVCATHPGLLGQVPFLRPAARGRVRQRSIGPGLPPSPSRLNERAVYYSPSTRASMRSFPSKGNLQIRSSCLRNTGDPERLRQRSGRRSGERGGPSTRCIAFISMSSEAAVEAQPPQNGKQKGPARSIRAEH